MILQGAIPILYAGVLSGGVGFTLQIVGQRHTNPTVASLLLSMEAVFGACLWIPSPERNYDSERNLRLYPNVLRYYYFPITG